MNFSCFFIYILYNIHVLTKKGALMEKYLTVSTAAKKKQCTRATIYDWLAKGIIAEETIGGKRFIVNDDRFQQTSVEAKGPIKKDDLSKLRNRVEQLEKENQALRKQGGGMAFTAVYEKSGKWWLGYVKEVPGAMTQQKSLEEAKAGLKEALQLLLQSYKDTFHLRMKDLSEDKVEEEIFV